MALSTSKQLYEAILLLREEEKKAQKELANRIKKRGAKKEVEVFEEEDEDEELFGGDEEGGGEESGAASDEEGGEEPSGEEGGEEPSDEEGDSEENKNGKLSGADELNDTPQELPQTLKGNDFVDKINKIRAGASLKDKDVQSRIVGYVKSLTSDERDDLWVNLDSLARIILGGVDPAQVLTPSLLTGPGKQKTNQSQQNVTKKEKKKDGSATSNEKYSDAPIVAPIRAVSEGVRKQMTEVPFVLRSNRTVPFGHSSHVRDLERLLSDLMRFRSCQERGSESWMSIGLAIKSIKTQLSHARRKSVGVRDTIDTVDIGSVPQLVEKD